MGFLGNLFRHLVHTVVFADEAVAPCPAVFHIVAVSLLKLVDEVVDGGYLATLHLVDHAQLLRQRNQHAAQVTPFALSDVRCRHAQDVALENRTDVYTQGDVIVFDALLQRRRLYVVVLIDVGLHVFARHLKQTLQRALRRHDASHGERRQPVEVDDRQFAHRCALVALGPLLDVAVESHRSEIPSRHEIVLLVVGDDIRERQFASVGMKLYLAEAYRVHAYLCRKQYVGSAGSLRATLQSAVVHRSHLVHVVREVRVRPGVIEGA